MPYRDAAVKYFFQSSPHRRNQAARDSIDFRFFAPPGNQREAAMSVRWDVHIPQMMQRHSGSAKATAKSDTPGDRVREAPADKEPDAISEPQPQT